MLLRQLAASLIRHQRANGIGALALQQAGSIPHTATSSCFASMPAEHASTSYLPSSSPPVQLQQHQQWQLTHTHMQSLQQWDVHQHGMLLWRGYSAAARDHHAPRGTMDAPNGGTDSARHPKYDAASTRSSSSSSSSREAASAGARTPRKHRDKYDPALPKRKFKKRPRSIKVLLAEKRERKSQQPKTADLQAWRRVELKADASYAEHVKAEAAAQKARLSGKFGTMSTRLVLQLLQQAKIEERQPTSQELYAEARAAFPGAFRSRCHFKSVLQVVLDNKWAGFHRPKDAVTNKRVPFTLYVTKLGLEQPLESQPSKLLRAAVPALHGLVQSTRDKPEAAPRQQLFQQ